MVLHRPSSGNLLTAAVSCPMKERRSGRVRSNGWRICGEHSLTFQKVTVSNRLSQSCEPATPYY